jgi:hypothetical protein
MVHVGACREVGAEAVEGRRGAPAPRRVPGGGREVAQREHAPAAGEWEARRAMHGQEVEEDGVAGRQVEAPDVERAAVGLGRSPR